MPTNATLNQHWYTTDKDGRPIVGKQRIVGEIQHDEAERVHLTITCSDGSKTERFIPGLNWQRFIQQITTEGLWTEDVGGEPVLWRRVDRIEVHR
jgi:hypothetical protein